MRGKYKARATNKRTEQEVEALIASLEGEVSELRAGYLKVADARQREQAAHAKEIARIAAGLAEAVSPELRAAKDQISELRDEMGKLRSTAAARIHRSAFLAGLLFEHLSISGKGIPDGVWERIDEALGRQHIGEAMEWKRTKVDRHVNGQLDSVAAIQMRSVAEIERSLT